MKKTQGKASGCKKKKFIFGFHSMMFRFFAVMIVFAFMMVPWGRSYAAENTPKNTVSFEKICDQFQQELTDYYGKPSFYKNQLPVEVIPDFFEQKTLIEIYQRLLEALENCDRASLPIDQQVIYGSIKSYVELGIEEAKYNTLQIIIDPLSLESGELSDPYYILFDITVDSVEGAEKYIVRLKQFDIFFAQLMRELKVREEAGVIPSQHIIDETYKNTMKFIDEHIKTDELYLVFEDKIKKLNLDEEQQRKLCQNAKEAIGDRMIKAYESLAQYLLSLKDKKKLEAGVWQLPNGDEYYKLLLKRNTSTNLTPEELHNLGLREVARLQTEVRVLFDKLGFTGMSLSEAFKKIEEQTLMTDENKVVDMYKTILKDTKAKLSNLFETIPQKNATVMPYRLGFSPAWNWSSSLVVDFTFPQYTYVMEATAYHEIYPGHFFQKIVVPQSNNKILNFFSSGAYIEGWALYAESLAYENGFYSDAESILGYMQFQLWRAARIVIDTGIHYKHWSREEAITYFSNTTGLSGFAEGEVDRYIRYPGQACSYMLGQSKILELREKAKSALGDQFNLKEFHTAVLQYGAIDMQNLEKAIDYYIASKQ